MPMARRRCTKTGPYDVSDLTISLPVAKIGGFRTVLGCHLTQGSLKSFSLPTTFQADDEGSIPFTRSNVFNGLGRGNPAFCVTPGCCFVSWRKHNDTIGPHSTLGYQTTNLGVRSSNLFGRAS